MNVQEMLARINAAEGELQSLEKVTSEGIYSSDAIMSHWV